MSLDLVDFHAHILPKLDHGSDSLQTSLAQLSYAQKFGVKRILSTSHFYPQSHLLSDFLKEREASYKELASANKTDVSIKLGAEVLLCDGLEHLENLEELCFTGTKYLLLELPLSGFSHEIVFSCEKLMNAGFDLILAHADRYQPENIETLLDYGISKLQINVSSLVSLFKKRHIFDWMSRDLVFMLGSGIHRADTNAYKNFSNAQKKVGSFLPSIMEKSNAIWDDILSV